MAKVIEFHVRDVFPQTARTIRPTLGQVVEFGARLKQSRFIGMREIFSTESWRTLIAKTSLLIAISVNGLYNMRC